MTAIYSSDELIERIPAFLEQVWQGGSREREDILVLIAANELDPTDQFGEEKHDIPSFQFAIDGEANRVFERRLRSAISRKLGKPVGTDKHWDLDVLLASITTGTKRVSLHLRPRYSLAELRTAAASWLSGDDAAAWAVTHGFVREDGSPTTGMHLSSADGTPQSLTLFMAPGSRPALTQPADADESLELILSYLGEELDPSSRPGFWERSSRTFSWKKMRSLSYEISFYDRSDHTASSLD